MSSWSTGTNVIKEVDTNKNLTCQMFEVRKQGGGTEYLVRKSDVTLGTKSVTQNGTYTAASDGKYGFSQFSVNVAGGSGSADSHGKPTGTIAPGGAGSAVVGTDPETGNDAVVGVDEDGQLVKTPLPSSIVLVTPPTKNSYTDGESIDLTGAVVIAKNADGTTWTNADYPNGHVSCSPEPSIASYSAKDNYIYGDANIKMLDTFITHDNLGREVIYDFGYPIFVAYKGDRSGVNFYSFEKITDTFPAIYAKVICSDGTVIYSSNDFSYYDFQVDDYNASVSSYPSGYSSLGNYLSNASGSFDGGPGTEVINLKWARPGDGKVLSTTMEINVGAHSTESSSGTEGSGGGGTF